MKLNDNVYVLELSNMDVTNPDKIYLTLINDSNHGLTLIDTGYPGQISLLKKAIENVNKKRVKKSKKRKD